MNDFKQTTCRIDLRDQLTVYEQFGWINVRAITFWFVDQSSSHGLENFGENIPTIPEVIWAHTLNIKPNFKFSSFFEGGPPSQFGCALASLLQSVARI